MATDRGGSWRLIDAGPPERMGAADQPEGHYVGGEFSDSEAALEAAKGRADESGHVIRVVKTLWPGSGEAP